MPARKIGREWKFSRRALIEWVGSGNSASFYREGNGSAEGETPADERGAGTTRGPATGKSRRTAGWRIEFD